MSNRFDYERLSDFVSGIINPKLRAISMSVSGSIGFIKSLVDQAAAKATAAAASASNANEFANSAAIASSAALLAYDSFVASFGGVSASDPVISAANQPFNSNAFYINSKTGQIRYATGVVNGQVTWSDVNSGTDASAIIKAGTDVFASLNATTVQIFNAPVRFKQIVSVPKVTDWSSQQAVGASDLSTIVGTLQTAIGACVTRTDEQRIEIVDLRVAQTTTITVPTWASRAEVHIVGAGGGGNFTGSNNGTNSGGGGGSGAWARGVMSVTPNQQLSITIGAGGAGATAVNTYGSSGGDTYIDNIVRMGGGQQASSVTSTVNGSSYTSSTAAGGLPGQIVKPHNQLFCFNGTAGDAGDFTNGSDTGGQGANGPFGGGGQPGAFGTIVASAPGAGGGGAYPTKGGNVIVKAAGRGADGAVLIRWLP